MSELVSPFRIDVFNAAGVRIGDGPIVSVVSLTDTRRLDKIGECKFTMPAADPRARLVRPGVQFDIYDAVDGYLGRFLFKERSIDETLNVALMTVSCFDTLRELTRMSVGYRRRYSFRAVDEVMADLISLYSGWTLECDPEIGNTTVTYEGESIFAAIDVLRDRWGQHFRLGETTRELEFGAFGVSSGVRLVNLQGQVPSEFEAEPNVVAVTGLRLVEEEDNVYNRIIAMGGGQGAAQLTLAGATAGDYEVKSRLNADNTTLSYIEDEASIERYGVRERVVTFSQIVPQTNTETSKQLARNALKLTAEAYLRRNKEPRVEYSVKIRTLRAPLKVGDRIHLRYLAEAENINYLDIDEEFYVMDITRTRSAEGTRSASINIASVDTRRTSDVDVISDVVRDVKVLKNHIQPGPTRFEYADSDTILGYFLSTARKDAEFEFEPDDSLQGIESVTLRLQTRPLIATTVHMDANAYEYFLPQSSGLYPSGISLIINGVDVSNQLGGKWNVGNVNQALDVKLDITDIIASAPGGFQQRHTIVVRADERFGDVPAATTDAVRPVQAGINLASQGIVRIKIVTQGYTQSVFG